MSEIAKPFSGNTTGRRLISMIRLRSAARGLPLKHEPAFDTSISNADRNFTIGLNRKNSRQARHLLDHVLRAFLNEAHRRVLTVGQEIGDINHGLMVPLGKSADNEDGVASDMPSVVMAAGPDGA